ncbi:MAG: hypothetical protein WDO73_37555 [Ignavibacteriota bacterium]
MSAIAAFSIFSALALTISASDLASFLVAMVAVSTATFFSSASMRFARGESSTDFFSESMARSRLAILMSCDFNCNSSLLTSGISGFVL